MVQEIQQGLNEFLRKCYFTCALQHAITGVHGTMHCLLCFCLLSLDFSSIETINTVNESINTAFYTSVVCTAMMHYNVNPLCVLAMQGWIGSHSASLSVTQERPTQAASYTKKLIQSR